jgi:outer membrane protein assembly factor BamE
MSIKTPSPSALRLAAWSLAGTFLVLAGGCSSLQSSENNLFGVITPYKVEVVQGNVVTKEMGAQVKPGMNRNQVREVLGSPLLADIFHSDRWDYVFTIRRQGAIYQERRATAYFEGDVLKRFESDDLPAERDFVNAIDTFKGGRRQPRLELTDEERRALPPPKTQAAATDASGAQSLTPQGAARTYPPLETP